MMGTANFSCRMDKDLKEQSETLYNELGMSLTTAFTVFLKESLRVGGLPFEVRLPSYNQETLQALEEAKNAAQNPAIKKYNVEDALAELKK